MKGDAKIIEFLNTVLKNELSAINQYFIHARMLEDWGVSKLGKLEYEESIDEMKHADEVIQRILFLEGHPNLQDLNKLQIGETVQEILECDLAIEHKAIADLREAVAYADDIRDYASRDLFAKILSDEEHHIDFIETQLQQIKLIGIQNYIQSQSA
tara:strand:+ start:223 stop:690 length:468 start_codon:yes stop_codon:yes gene_type:complete